GDQAEIEGGHDPAALRDHALDESFHEAGFLRDRIDATARAAKASRRAFEQRSGSGCASLGRKVASACPLYSKEETWMDRRESRPHCRSLRYIATSDPNPQHK